MSQRHTLEDVRRVKAKVEDDLLRRPGVTGVDVGYKHVAGRPTTDPALIVYVRKKGGVSPEDAVPPEIEGVPTDVVERSFEAH